jgi:hypothetical protein
LWIHRNEKSDKIEAEMPDTSVAEGFVSAVMEGGQNNLVDAVVRGIPDIRDQNRIGSVILHKRIETFAEGSKMAFENSLC